MAPKNKKAAAKKKNDKKNKERAALAAKQALEKKKIAESPESLKAKSKADRKKEKQLLKEQKQKDKIEQKRQKRQEKIKKLKQRKKLVRIESKQKYKQPKPEFVEKFLAEDKEKKAPKRKKEKKSKKEKAAASAATDTAIAETKTKKKTNDKKAPPAPPAEEAAHVILPDEDIVAPPEQPTTVAAEVVAEIVIEPEVPDEYRTAALDYEDRAEKAPKNQKATRVKKEKKSRKAKVRRAAVPKTAAAKSGRSLLKRVPTRARKPLIAAVALFVLVPALLFGGSELMLRLAVPKDVVTQYLGMRESPVNTRDIELETAEQLSLARKTRARGDTRAFRFFAANKTVTINEWYDPIAFGLGNPDTNDCDLVFILLDKNGEYAYRSLGVAPGQYLPSMELFQTLQYGEHKYTLIVVGYEPDKVNPETNIPETYKLIGVQYTKLKLVVGIEQETTTAP